MTRRKNNKLRGRATIDRKARIAKLIALGWIKDEKEIPPDAIAIDPDRINLGGSWSRPTCFRAVEFICRDCGKPQIGKRKTNAGITKQRARHTIRLRYDAVNAD